MDNEKIYLSKKELLNCLGIKDSYLYTNFSTKYSKFQKPKRSGGFRPIEPPNLNLRKIQRIILDKILSKNKLLDCIYGFSKEKGVLGNAKFHQVNSPNELLLLDIENFFPSISKKRVLSIFRKLGFNKENSSILTKICTVNNSLPQGAPTSPYLASLACVKLDKQIFNYCKKRNLIYSRYFDDISISGKSVSLKNIKDIIKIIEQNNLKCNHDKTSFFGCNTSKVINNVMLNSNSLSVSDIYKNEIKLAYIDLVKDNSSHNKRVFAGKIGFFLHINRKEGKKFRDYLSKEFK